MEEKVYVALKSNTEISKHYLYCPHLVVKWHKRSQPMDLYNYGIRYYEDEIGWYYKHAELTCTIN